MFFFFLPACAICSIFFLPYFLIPTDAATAAGLLAPFILADRATAANRAPDPSFAVAINMIIVE